MRVSTAILVLGLGLAGCGIGVTSDLEPVEVLPSFSSKVEISPTRPLPGKRVSFNINITNTSDVAVMGKLELEVTSESGKEIYSQSWDNVSFGPKENWNLTQGFTAGTDTEKVPYYVGLRLVRGDGVELPYYENPNVISFSFGAGSADGGL
jgi:hypothetical protein